MSPILSLAGPRLQDKHPSSNVDADAANRTNEPDSLIVDSGWIGEVHEANEIDRNHQALCWQDVSIPSPMVAVGRVPNPMMLESNRTTIRSLIAVHGLKNDDVHDGVGRWCPRPTL